jgi:hypothetical protein
LSALVAIFVVNASFTRGYVTDGEGHPLVGADILLADSARVVAAVKADGKGYFRIAHAPFASIGWSLLICSAGRFVYYDSQVTSALIRSEYGIGPAVAPHRAPASLGWQASVPRSCPSASVAPAG